MLSESVASWPITWTVLGLLTLPGSATFYLFVSIEGSRLSSDEFCTRLLSEVPGLRGSRYRLWKILRQIPPYFRRN